ncbi:MULTISPECIES: hypothetical protein [unclassified Afipia]|uniref:hypothetical protein n=1 Tax=unclassified Afipia TaxID=2642050 RepID=UPI0003FEF644|nr:MULTISPECIES: hypothetical protein [unclassified Afipia]
MKKDDLSFGNDAKKRAEALRAEAEKLPYGRARDGLLKQARQLDPLAECAKWANSPALRPPE